jgi:ribonuclease VapC
MVIDTSAMIAVLLEEAESAAFVAALEADGTRLLSAVNFVEAGIVLERRVGPEANRDLLDFIDEAEIEIVPVDLDQANLARHAYTKFGRGNHPAGLNFGDCFAYALAAARGEPLLYKGDDFSRTDVAPAISA